MACNIKSLSRDPLKEWKRMVESNIESMQGRCSLLTGDATAPTSSPDVAVVSSKLGSYSSENDMKIMHAEIKHVELINNHDSVNEMIEEYDNFCCNKTETSCYNAGNNDHDKIVGRSISEEKREIIENEECHSINFNNIDDSHDTSERERPLYKNVITVGDLNDVKENLDKSEGNVMNNHRSRCETSETDSQLYSLDSLKTTSSTGVSTRPLHDTQIPGANIHALNETSNDTVGKCTTNDEHVGISVVKGIEQKDGSFCNEECVTGKNSFEGFVRPDRDMKQADKLYNIASDLSNTGDLSSRKISSRDLFSGKSNTRDLSNDRSSTRDLSNDKPKIKDLSNSRVSTRYLSVDRASTSDLSNSKANTKYLSNDRASTRYLSVDRASTRDLSNKKANTKDLSNAKTNSKEISNGITNMKNHINGKALKKNLSNGKASTRDLSNGKASTRDVSNGMKSTKYLSNEKFNTRDLSTRKTNTRDHGNGTRNARYLSNGKADTRDPNGKTDTRDSSNGKADTKDQSNGKADREDPCNGKADTRDDSNGKADTRDLSKGKADTRNQSNGKTDTRGPSNGKTDTRYHINAKAYTQDQSNGKTDTRDPSNGKAYTRDQSNGKTDTRDQRNGKADTRDERNRKDDTRDPSNGKADTRDPSNGKADTRDSSNGKADRRDSSNGKADTKDPSNGKADTRDPSNGKADTRDQRKEKYIRDPIDIKINTRDHINCEAKKLDLCNGKAHMIDPSNGKASTRDLSNDNVSQSNLRNGIASTEDLCNGNVIKGEANSHEIDLNKDQINTIYHSNGKIELSNGKTSKRDLSEGKSNKRYLCIDNLCKRDLSNDKDRTRDLSNGNVSKRDLSNGNVSKRDLSNGNVSKRDLSNDKDRTRDLSNGNVSKRDLSNGNVSKRDLSNSHASKRDLSNGKDRTRDLSNGNVSKRDLCNGKDKSRNLNNVCVKKRAFSNRQGSIRDFNSREISKRGLNDENIKKEAWSNENVISRVINNRRFSSLDICNDKSSIRGLCNGKASTRDLSNGKASTRDLSNGEASTRDLSNGKACAKNLNITNISTTVLSNGKVAGYSELLMKNGQVRLCEMDNTVCLENMLDGKDNKDSNLHSPKSSERAQTAGFISSETSGLNMNNTQFMFSVMDINEDNTENMSDLNNADNEEHLYLQNDHDIVVCCEKSLNQCKVHDINHISELGKLSCVNNSEITDFGNVGNTVKERTKTVITLGNITMDASTNYYSQATKVSSAAQKGCDSKITDLNPVDVDALCCMTESALCCTNPYETNEVIPGVIHIQGKCNSAKEFSCGDGHSSAYSSFENRQTDTADLPLLPLETDTADLPLLPLEIFKQNIMRKCSSTENIAVGNRRRKVRKCRTNNRKSKTFDMISSVDMPKHVISRAKSACEASKGGRSENVDYVSMQDPSETSKPQSSNLNQSGTKDSQAADYGSCTSLKSLTRNPMTQWKRLVDINVESMLTSRVDRAKYGGGDFKVGVENKVKDCSHTNLEKTVLGLDSSLQNASLLKATGHDTGRYCQSYDVLRNKDVVVGKGTCNVPMSVECFLQEIVWQSENKQVGLDQDTLHGTAAVYDINHTMPPTPSLNNRDGEKSMFGSGSEHILEQEYLSQPVRWASGAASTVGLFKNEGSIKMLNEINLSATSVCEQDLHRITQESDTRFEIQQITNQYKMNLCNDNLYQMSLLDSNASMISLRNSALSNMSTSKFTQCYPGADCKQLEIKESNAALYQNDSGPNALSLYNAGRKPHVGRSRLVFTPAHYTEETRVSNVINNVAIDTILISDYCQNQIPKTNNNEMSTLQVSKCCDQISSNLPSKWASSDHKLNNTTIEVLDELALPLDIDDKPQNTAWSRFSGFITSIFKGSSTEITQDVTKINQTLNAQKYLQSIEPNSTDHTHKNTGLETIVCNSYLQNDNDINEQKSFSKKCNENIFLNEKGENQELICTANRNMLSDAINSTMPSQPKMSPNRLLDEIADYEVEIFTVEKMNTKIDMNRCENNLVYSRHLGDRCITPVLSAYNENNDGLDYRLNTIYTETGCELSDEWKTKTLSSGATEMFIKNTKYNPSLQDKTILQNCKTKIPVLISSSYNTRTRKFRNMNKLSYIENECDVDNHKHENSDNLKPNNVQRTGTFTANIISGEAELKHFLTSQKESQNMTCDNLHNEDTASVFEESCKYKEKLERDGPFNETKYAQNNKEECFVESSNISVSRTYGLISTIQCFNVPVTVKAKLSVCTEAIPSETTFSDCMKNAVKLDYRTEPILSQHSQSCCRDEHTELVGSDLLQSSLECLLEMLLQRGKVIHAVVANTNGEVIAKTANFVFATCDIRSLVCSLSSTYQGMVKMAVFNDVYTCFKHDQDSSLIGTADSGIFVAQRGKQSIVVGFSDPHTPGSCIKEIQEISHLLHKRGL